MYGSNSFEKVTAHTLSKFEVLRKYGQLHSTGKGSRKQKNSKGVLCGLCWRRSTEICDFHVVFEES